MEGKKEVRKKGRKELSSKKVLARAIWRPQIKVTHHSSILQE
jgi:hypothetical protein